MAIAKLSAIFVGVKPTLNKYLIAALTGFTAPSTSDINSLDSIVVFKPARR